MLNTAKSPTINQIAQTRELGLFPFFIAGLILVLLATAAYLLLNRPAPLPPNHLSLSADTMTFAMAELTATGNTLTLTFDNDDFLPHTFTVDEIGLNLKALARDSATATFTAAPGSYTFYCAIPGHRAAGMTGTLIINP